MNPRTVAAILFLTLLLAFPVGGQDDPVSELAITAKIRKSTLKTTSALCLLSNRLAS